LACPPKDWPLLASMVKALLTRQVEPMILA
jgi:hypothetical protein